MSFQMKFTRRFSLAHRFINCDSVKCMTPHGHNWFVMVYLVSTNPQPLDQDKNMIEEFAKAKKSWHNWVDEHLDHSFGANSKDPYLEIFNRDGHRLTVTPGDPTTEMLAALFWAKCTAFIRADKNNLKIIRVEIEETPTNTVIMEEEPWTHLPNDPTGSYYWWNRADMSTHDLEREKFLRGQ